MGNTSSIPADETSDIHSLPYSGDQFQADNELLTPSSPSSNYPLDSQARYELRAQLFKCSSQELQNPTASNHPTTLLPSPTAMTKPDRVDISEALAVLQQFKQSASPEQLLALQNALLPSGYQTAPTSPNASNNEVKVTRPGKPDNLVRRKSYFTPGVATREKSKKLQKRPTSTRQPSASNTLEQQTWNAEMFGQSPLSKLAGWESKNDGLSERAITPDINHSYLGTHVLGSLRVTNGVPSPAPSVYSKLVSRKPSQSSIKRHEDFFTASEGSESDVMEKTSDPMAIQPPGSGGFAKSNMTPTKVYMGNPEHWQSVPEFQNPLSCSKNDLQSTSDLRPVSSSDTLRKVAKLESSDDPLQRSPSVLKPYQHELNSNPFLDSTSDAQPVKIHEDIESPVPSPCKQSPVLLYQNEAESNPFLAMEDDTENYPSSGLKLCPGTGPENHQDIISPLMLDSDDGPTSRPPANRSDPEFEVVVPRPKAFSRLNAEASRDRDIFSAASSIYSAGSRRETPHPDYSSKKHDSGYGSEASRQTSKDTLIVHSVSAPCSSHASPAEEIFDPTEQIVWETNHVNPVIKHQPKPVPFSKYTEPLDVSKPLPQSPPAMRVPAPSQAPRPSPRPQSTPNLLLLSSPASGSSADLQKQSPGRKKLQKKRPKSRRMSSEPLIVQTQPSIEQPVNFLPQIPADISARHTERLNQHPKMNHLERTYKSVAHEKSYESLHSAGPFDVQIRFPSPARAPESEETRPRRSDHRRSSFGGEHIQSFFRRGERSKSGSGPRPQEYAPISIADFGTVSGSLGSSPYDLANPAGHQERRGRVRGPRVSQHPHQMGYQSSRAKSAIGMTDEMASRFAQRKSRDRQEQVDEIERPREPPKPRNLANHWEGRSELRSSKTHYGHPMPPKANNQQLRRPKSWYDTGAIESENVKPNVERAVPVANPTSKESTKIEAETTTLAADKPSNSYQEADWTASANAWRLRRKSIGQNLRNNGTQEPSNPHCPDTDRNASKRPQTPHNRPPSPTPPKRRPPIPVYASLAKPPGADKYPAQPIESQGQHSKVEAPEPTRSSSPSPSVRERAAAYERSINAPSSPDRQSPTRRPPSPLKSTAYNIKDAEQIPPIRSKFSVAPTSTASPSGVASAYTVSENSFGAAQKSEPAPTLFQRPVDLSPPKRRGTNVTRKPIGGHISTPSH